jgi:uncharacterized membrane protein YhfC
MWQSITAWFKSKGGVAHVIAGAWAFLIFAYATEKPFHDYIVHLKDMLPPWIEDMVTAIVPLFMLYKTWDKTQTVTAPADSTVVVKTQERIP